MGGGFKIGRIYGIANMGVVMELVVETNDGLVRVVLDRDFFRRWFHSSGYPTVDSLVGLYVGFRERAGSATVTRPYVEVKYATEEARILAEVGLR